MIIFHNMKYSLKTSFVSSLFCGFILFFLFPLNYTLCLAIILLAASVRGEVVIGFSVACRCLNRNCES